IRPSPTFLTFRASSEAPPVGPLPALENGYVTFCSFNAIWKLNPLLIALWTRVLHAVPNSRLLMKSTGLDDEATAQRIRDQFASHDLDLNRLQLVARAPSYSGHL